MILVITVIESLRAFDLVVHHQPRPQRTRAAVGAGHQQHHRRGEPDRLRLGDRRRAAGRSRSVPIIVFLIRDDAARRRDDREPRRAPATREAAAGQAAARAIRRRRVVLHAFLIAMAACSGCSRCSGRSTRRCGPYADTSQHGYVSLPRTLNFDNYVNAWNQGEICRLLPEHADHRRPGGHPDPAARVDGRLRCLARSAGGSTCSC